MRWTTRDADVAKRELALSVEPPVEKVRRPDHEVPVQKERKMPDAGDMPKRHEHDRRELMAEKTRKPACPRQLDDLESAALEQVPEPVGREAMIIVWLLVQS